MTLNDTLLSWWTLDDFRNLGNTALKAVIIFVAFWIAAQIVHAIIRRIQTRANTSADLLDLLGRVAKLALTVLGVVTALGTAGVDVSALVAGLGLTGFAMGFAFRDVLSNLLAGILILLYRPFARGARISVTGLEGTVTDIDLRYTRLESNGDIILIPNSSLFTNPIRVFSPDDTPQI